MRPVGAGSFSRILRVKAMIDAQSSLGFRIWRAQPSPMASDHAHADIEVNFIQSGEIRYLMGGAWRTYCAGQVVAFWAALPHHLVSASPGACGVWLTVPLSWFLGQPAARDLVGALLTQPVVDQRPGDDALFSSWADTWDCSNTTTERIVRLEVEARLLRLSTPPPRPSATPCAHQGEADPVPTEVAADAVVTAMAALMAAHYSEELRVDDIAANTGLHPRYAMARFKQALGITVWEYLLRLRIAAAQGLLLTTNNDLLTVAFASGFGSPARFYATFKRLTGMTPRDYRRLHGVTKGEKGTKR